MAEIPANNPVGEALVASRDVGSGANAREGTSPSPTTVIWQPDESIGSGIYLVRVKIEDTTSTKKVIFIK